MYEVDRIGVVEENVNNKRKVLFVEFWMEKMENSINETYNNNANFMSNRMVREEIKKSSREDEFAEPIEF